MREEWLRKCLKMPHCTPSDATFRRIFTALDPNGFNECFIEFSASRCRRLSQELVAIDGKGPGGVQSLVQGADGPRLPALPQ